MTLHHQAYCAVLVVFLWACGSSAQAIGYWHLPSTPAQFCGLGCGPGHHVPMIRTHGCRPLRVSRCVHTRGCLTGGLGYCGTFQGGYESPGCHAELDALISPDNRTSESVVAPEPVETLLPIPQKPDQQVLPTPQAQPHKSPRN